MGGRRKTLALLAAVVVAVPVAFAVLGNKVGDDPVSTAEAFVRAAAAADIEAVQSLILMTAEMKENLAKDPTLLTKMREGLERDEIHTVGLERVKAYACRHEKKSIMGADFEEADCKVDVILKNGVMKRDIGNIELMKVPGSTWKVALP